MTIGDEVADSRPIGTGNYAIRQRLHARQDGKCHYCGVKVSLGKRSANQVTVDHRRPIALGGSDQMDNLVASCPSCNNRKGMMLESEFMAMLLLGGGARECEPAELPDDALLRASIARVKTAMVVPVVERGPPERLSLRITYWHPAPQLTLWERLGQCPPGSALRIDTP